MLALVTSLRHPQNSHDYARVESIFEQALQSWLRQTNPRFIVLVVGNQAPHLPLPPQVTFVPVDFDPPSDHRGPRTGVPAVLRDKGTKLAIGLLVAREHPDLTHVMFVDSDDFLSQRLAGFVADHPDARGWTITHGWRYNPHRRAVRPHRGDFHLQCGSSHIVRHDLYPSVDLPSSASQDQLYAGFGDRLERWIGSHMYIREDLSLPALPFPGALYQVGSGEAHSGNSMGSLGAPVSRAVAAEFGVPSTGSSLRRIMKAVLPSPEAVDARLDRIRRLGAR